MAERDTPGSRAMHTLTIRSAKKAPEPCSLLERLPGELRNIIYELVYNNCAPKNETISLRRPKAPSNALLLACRRTYIEAHDYYLEANKRYWREGKFEFRYNFDTHRLRKYDFDRLGRNLELINHLHIRVDAAPYVKVTWDLVDRRGIWRFEQQYSRSSPVPPSHLSPVGYMALHLRRKVGSKIIRCPTLELALIYCEVHDINHTLYSQLYHVFSRQFLV